MASNGGTRPNGLPRRTMLFGAAAAGSAPLVQRLRSCAIAGQIIDPGAIEGTDQEQLVWAIGQLNAGLTDGIDLAGRTWEVTAELPPITANSGLLRGDGATLSLRHPGRALVFGTPQQSCMATAVDRLNLDCTVPNDGVSPTVDMVNAVEVSWSQSRWANMGFALRLGGDSTRAQRCTIEHLNVSLSAVGAGVDGNIVVRNAASARLSNVHMNGAFPSRGSMLLVRPHRRDGAALVDTMWVTDSSFQCFSSSAPGSADGKEHCLAIDMTNGPTHNIWATNCVFDHARSASVLIAARAGAEAIGGRFIRVVNCRMDADAGHCVRIDNTGGVVMDGYQLSGNVGWVSSAGPAVVVDDPLLATRAMLVADNRFLATSPAPRRAGIVMNATNFHAVNNYVGCTVVGGGGWAAAVEVANRRADRFVISGNICEGDVAVIEPVYAEASAGRIVAANSPGR